VSERKNGAITERGQQRTRLEDFRNPHFQEQRPAVRPGKAQRYGIGRAIGTKGRSKKRTAFSTKTALYRYSCLSSEMGKCGGGSREPSRQHDGCPNPGDPDPGTHLTPDRDPRI